jgi:crotonobetainyl-CoA:carnitine CoA-transferase CaiB-like acyl-CoA transferase
MIQAMGGIMDLTGQPDREPQKVGVAYADIFTGLYASVAILAALRRRDETGEGCHIDMALLDTQVGVLANQAMNYLASGKPPTRMGNAHPNIVPYQVFPVSDGHVVVAVGNDAQFNKFVEVLGSPELALDARFTTNSDRVRFFAGYRFGSGRDDRGECLAVKLLAALEAKHVPAGPINNVADVFADPQVRHRRMRVDLPAAEAHGGSIPGVRTPILLDGIAAVADRPAPRLGASTGEVLADPNWGGVS